jgi:hypothetical protein
VLTRRTNDIESGLWLSTPRANEIPRSENFAKGRTPSPSEYAEIMNKKILLTPTTREEVQDLEKFKTRMEKYPNGTTMPNLATQIHQMMLPTPTTRSDSGRTTTIENGKIKNKSHTTGINYGITLGQLAKAKMLPTPQAMEGEKITGLENQDSLTKRARQITGKTSQLNPLFVEEMMGFPENWTALPFQNGDKSQLKHTETQ